MVYKKRPMKKRGQKRPNVANVVKRVLARQVEVKQTDVVLQQSPIFGAMSINLVNGIAEGTTDFQRVGNEINCKYLRLKGAVTFPDATNRVRLMVIVDKQCNGVAPTLAELFTFSSFPVSSFMNPDSKGRFKVLRDQIMSGGTGGPVAKTIDWYVKNNFKTYFSSGSSTVGDIRTNAMYVISLSDSGAIPNPSIDLACRFAYTD